MHDVAELFVDSRCELGEGPFWHPLLGRLFWFDILNQTLLSANEQGHIVDRITFTDVVTAAAVVRHAPDGSVDRVVELPVSRVTCPAFGGPDYKTLFVTSARENMTDEDMAREPHAGSVFAIEVEVPGLPEPPLAL